MPVLRARLANVPTSCSIPLRKPEGNRSSQSPIPSKRKTRARPLKHQESHSVESPLRLRALSLTASGRGTHVTSKKPIRKSLETAKPVPVKRRSSRDKDIPTGGQRKAPLDPYAFDAVLDSDNEKENIDPRQTAPTSIGKFTDEGQQDSSRSRSRIYKRPTFAPSASSRRSSHSFSRVTADAERLRNATATIRLPLPHQFNEPCLSATPIFTHAPLASTPSVQSADSSAIVKERLMPCAPNLISPVLKHPVQCDTQVTPVEKVTDSAKPHPHVRISLELFEDDVIPEGTDTVAGTSKERSTHSSSKSGSRGSRSSVSKGDYSSWLDEFNAQLEQFESHNLTVEQDESK